jgi:hypothetical protein
VHSTQACQSSAANASPPVFANGSFSSWSGKLVSLLPVVTPAGGLALVAGTVEGSDQSPASRLVQRLSTAGFQLSQHEVGRSGLRLDRVT